MPGSNPPAAEPLDRAGHSAWAVPLFIVGVSLLAFNMRAAITSVPPIFPELSAHQHLPSAVLAALAATPVLCFALFAPVAAPASRRFGEERVLLAALVLLAAGLGMRAALPRWLLFPGTMVAAGAIALMNVLLPSLVKRRRPGQAGLLIGIYLLCLCAGGILGSLLAVPVFQASGGSVPLALGMWAFPAIVAAAVWLPQRRQRTMPAVPGTGPPGRPRPPKMSRHLLAWQVMGFMGLQSLTYYAALSWLPVLFRDRGAGAVSAGTLLAVMNVGNAVTALPMPVLAHRSRDQRLLTASTVVVTTAGLAGVWLAPLSTAAAWTFLLGMGQGAALGLGVYFTAARAPDPVSAASLSGFAQGAGYLVAIAGPLAVGLLHAATGGWALPMAVLLVALAGQLAAGLPAARDRTLPSGDSGQLLLR